MQSFDDAGHVTMLERLSKYAVVISACLAIGLGTWLGARAWAPLLPGAVAAFVVAFAVGKWRGTVVWAPVMLFAYILPAVLLFFHGYNDQAYWNLWMAALLGGICGTGRLSAWSFPARWKWPLVFWALAIALVWPVIVAREADFSWALMSQYNIALSVLGGPPPVTAVFVLGVALTHLVGLLWLDAAVAAFPSTDQADSLKRYTPHVLWPLAVSVILGSLVAIYQGTVDITWLSEHQYVILRRATASLDDGNAFGAAAGVWIGGLLALSAMTSRRWVRVVAILGMSIAGAGLWATGSRMALLAALICAVAALWFGLAKRKTSLREVLLVAVPAVVLVAGFGILQARSSNTNPLDRVVKSLPELSADGLRKWASFELWNRYGPYGTVSMNMVKDYPLSGIGVGSFNHIFTDESFRLTRDPSHKDNAQSWYRHQLAELGVLGSLGWLVWLPMFVVVLVRTRGDEGHVFEATMVKGALVAVGVICAVSMPTQSIPVAFTVWVFVYWYLLLSSSAADAAARPTPAFRSAWWPAGVWLAAVVFVAASGWAGWRDLRPPFRALRADWTYQLGFMLPDPPDPDLKYRWIDRHAIEVLPVGQGWLKLTVSGGPPDMATNPLHFEVRRQGKVIIAGIRLSPAEDTWYVKVPDGAKRMMLEFKVSRTWRPSDHGGSDTREVGLRIHDWTFVKDPPRGAIAID